MDGVDRLFAKAEPETGVLKIHSTSSTKYLLDAADKHEKTQQTGHCNRSTVRKGVGPRGALLTAVWSVGVQSRAREQSIGSSDIKRVALLPLLSGRGDLGLSVARTCCAERGMGCQGSMGTAISRRASENAGGDLASATGRPPVLPLQLSR